MLRIGSIKKGVYVLSTKDMQQIHKVLFYSRMNANCIWAYMDAIERLWKDDYKIHFSKEAARNIHRRLTQLSNKMKLYLLS